MLTWPSEPAEDGSVPTVMELLGAEERVALHAKTLITGSAKLKEKGLRPEAYQVVVDGQLGKFTLPGLGVMPDGSHRILYGHNGDWDETDLNQLFKWTIKVRARQETERVPIVLLTEPDHPPPRAAEIVSCRPSSLIVILAVPYQNLDAPSENARLMQHVLTHLFGTEFSFDRKGVEALDEMATHGIAPVSDDAFLRLPLMALLGAFTGEAVVRVHGGQWRDSSVEGHPEWMKVVDFGECQVSPMGRASKFLRDPKGEPLVDFFDSSRPERLKAILGQIQRES
jgi:hypothetical protein